MQQDEFNSVAVVSFFLKSIVYKYMPLTCLKEELPAEQQYPKALPCIIEKEQ